MDKHNKQAGRAIAASFAVLVLAAATFLLFKIAEQKRVIDSRNVFTSLEISLSGNKTYTISGAPRDNRFIVIFFDADCYYCHLEAEAIVSNIDLLEGIDIYMITSGDQETVMQFEERHGLAVFPSIKTGRVCGETILNGYGIRAVPSLLVYDETGRLIFSNFGYTPVDDILAALDL
ncbi:MAG: thioredoxin family protein [Marinilabiliales bacterium]|nr:MAG: thioredoxin family protein [Marinilabiliales bacterium]